MTDKIYREVATKKYLSTNPMSKRYALFCKGALEENSGVNCSSKETNGHLGDYDDSITIEEAALAHEHPVIFRYKAVHQAKFYDH